MNDFVKDISFGVRYVDKETARTAPNTFCGNDVHLEWLKYYCSGTNSCSQYGIEMKYNCGPFYLTAAFPQPMFVHHEMPDKHPTIQQA